MNRLRLFVINLLLRKEVDELAVVYATLIVKGQKSLDQVPAMVRKQVEDILAALEVM